MKLISRTISYYAPNNTLRSSSGIHHVVLCVSDMQMYFNIPTTEIMSEENKKYIISLHTTAEPNSLKIKLDSSDHIYVEHGDNWKSYRFYWETEVMLIRFLKIESTNILHVVLEEK